MFTAQSTASTELPNSTRDPSPMSLTVRPRCSAMRGSITLRPQLLKRTQRACLVRPHEAAVANYVGRHHGSEAPLDTHLGHNPPPSRVRSAQVEP